MHTHTNLYQMHNTQTYSTCTTHKPIADTQHTNPIRLMCVRETEQQLERKEEWNIKQERETEQGSVLGERQRERERESER